MSVNCAAHWAVTPTVMAKLNSKELFLSILYLFTYLSNSKYLSRFFLTRCRGKTDITPSRRSRRLEVTRSKPRCREVSSTRYRAVYICTFTNRFYPRGPGPGDEVTAQTPRPHIGARHRLCHCAKLGVCTLYTLCNAGNKLVFKT